MKIGLGIGIGRQNRGGPSASFAVSLTGLTDGQAIIGTHASIGYTITPDNGTETVKWSASADPLAAATYGTGASPTDFTSADGFSLYLHVTDGGETVTRSAPVRFAAGTAPAIADGQSWTVDDTAVSIDASASGANLTWTYVLTGSATGVAINPSTGLISGTPTAVGSGTATVTATDQYGRTVQDTFTWASALRTQATAAGALSDQNWTVDDDTINLDLTGDFTANGNTLSYAIAGLPTGTIDDGDGTISGTPTVDGQSGTITITATDEYGRTTASAFSYTTAYRAQATGGVDLDLSFQEGVAITATDLTVNWTKNGNTLTYAIVGTALPDGLSVSSAGLLTGTPTTTTADATYTLRGTDEYGRTTDDTFTLEITAAVAGVAAFAKWKPSSVSGWTDTVGGTQAGIGDAVAVLEDDSGNGRHLVFASGRRPLLQQEGTGEFYLDFTSDAGSVALDLSAGAQVSIVSAWRRDTATGNHMLYEFSPNFNTNAGTFFCYGPNGGNVFLNANNTASANGYSGYATSVNGTTAAVFSHVVDFNGTTRDTESIHIRVDGVSDKAVADGSYVNVDTNVANSTLYVGARAGSSLFADGRLYFLAVYNSALDLTDLATVEAEAANNTPGVSL